MMLSIEIDEISPLHWFPVEADRIVRLNLKVGLDLNERL